MQTRQVKSDEARRTFRNVLNEVEHGGFVEILRYEEPTAVMVPIDWFARAKAALEREAR